MGGGGVMILFFFKDRSSLQYFITQGMGKSSMFLTFRTICNFRGRTSALVKVGGGKGGILVPIYIMKSALKHNLLINP